MAPSLDRWREPSASVVVHTISMAMGMEATSSTTVKDSASRTCSPFMSRKPKAMEHRASESTTSTSMMRSSIFSRLELSRPPCSRAAVLPKKVLPPVAATVASTSPRTTVEPILTLSPSNSVTGSDSPVRAAWSTSIYTHHTHIQSRVSTCCTTPPCNHRRPLTLPTCPWLSRQSAGTAPPAPSSTRSPGTTSAASMVIHLPSRFTVARGFSDACTHPDT